eukprot:6173489-Pleurochrysis_carterae.AAC.1
MPYILRSVLRLSRPSHHRQYLVLYAPFRIGVKAAIAAADVGPPRSCPPRPSLDRQRRAARQDNSWQKTQ